MVGSVLERECVQTQWKYRVMVEVNGLHFKLCEFDTVEEAEDFCERNGWTFMDDFEMYVRWEVV